MKKVSKNIINKDIIAKDLRDENKKGSFVSLCLAFIYLIVVGSTLSVIYFFGLKSNGIGELGYFIFFASVVICLLPLFFIISNLIQSIIGQNGSNLYVITDEVVYKEEKIVRKSGPDTLIEKKIIHFYKYGELEVNSTLYEITDNNDAFYIVLKDRESNRVLKCYPAKLYEYVE